MATSLKFGLYPICPQLTLRDFLIKVLIQTIKFHYFTSKSIKLTMKTYLLCFAFLLTGGLAFGQVTFTDDFESYEIGQYLGDVSEQWTTWSGNTGGAEDVTVNTDQAASGEKSIHIAGAAGGGPQDVLLLFGDRYTTGNFTFSMNMFVPQGSGAYFNFQGEEAPGTIWNFQGYFDPTGEFSADNGTGGATVLVNTYPVGEWFNIIVDANLSSNLWRVSINNNCIGSFVNVDGDGNATAKNAVATLDLFPRDESDNFYVDDISFTYEEEAEMISYNFDASISAKPGVRSGIAGEGINVTALIGNNGNEEINSVTVNMTTDAGETMSAEVDGLNIARGQLIPVDLGDIALENGENPITMTISDVNGQADENQCNDISRVVLTGFTPKEGKAVWVEEATGTWCTFCPRGDVWMNRLAEAYGDKFVGIAVHNGDPMAIAPWNNGVTSVPGFTGFPSVVVARGTITDPATMESNIVSQLQTTPLVRLENAASYDEDTRELTVEVRTNFDFPVSGDIRLVVGLSEDEVTGTESGYDQINAFSGGAPCSMGGYEALPNPVPASMMVYNHVGRFLFTPFDGLENTFEGDDTSAGSSVVKTFTVVLPEEWNPKNMHIVSAFRAATGGIDNSAIISVNDAVDLGLFTLGAIDQTLDAGIDVYPNPFRDVANIRINLETPQAVSMEVTDAMGQLVAQRNYGTISGDQVFSFYGTALESGVYYMKLISGDKFTTKKVVISH